MEFSTEFWVQMGVYFATFGYMYGSLKTEMKYMKEKLDKHNSFQDRLTVMEAEHKGIKDKLKSCSDSLHEYFRRS